MNLYTADPHFGRTAVIKSAQRPFSDVSEMNEAIIRNYQDCVRDTDDLFMIGDLVHKSNTRDEAKFWFDRIPGRKHLISGNHDAAAVLGLPWHSVQPYLEMEEDGRMLVLFHYPMLTWNQARAGSLHLFGHVHQNWAGSERAVNVGVDFWDFRPCSLRDIETKSKTLGPHPHWDVIEPNF